MAATTSKREQSRQRHLLDVGQAADYLGTGERFVRRLIAERRVPFHRVGRHIRFDVADLDSFLASSRVEASGQDRAVR